MEEAKKESKSEGKKGGKIHQLAKSTLIFQCYIHFILLYLLILYTINRRFKNSVNVDIDLNKINSSAHVSCQITMQVNVHMQIEIQAC